MSAHMDRVLAVVVAYYPDAGLVDRLKKILFQVETVVIVDNTPESSAACQLEPLLTEVDNIRVISNCRNLGLSAALNQGLKCAAESKCDWLLTLDQDSHCFPNMVQTLIRAKDNCTRVPNIVGSNFSDPRNDKPKVPVGNVGECHDQTTVITSGCLVDVCFAQAIGGFREDYFIDQVDYEFCLRARAHGGRVVICNNLVMEHSVGEVGGAWLPYFGRLPNHSPQRKYYIARNAIVTIGNHWQTEPTWCFWRFVRLGFGFLLLATLERQRSAKVKAFLSGVFDAAIGKMGPL